MSPQPLILRSLLLALCLACAPLSVSAASLESLISPGDLSEAHAEYDDECSSCHETFDRSAQTALCLDCHEDIAADIDRQEGYHSKHPEVRDAPCRACHTEHAGREFDITGLTPETFEHQYTDFELVGAHTSVSCAQCHVEGKLYREAPSACIDCHGQDDPHDGNLGEGCNDCHSEENWTDSSFDHAEQTEYELIGAHARQPCESCHVDQQYEQTPTQCIDCHKADDVHAGSRGDQCDTCHNSNDWEESRFDHKQETGFALVNAHGELNCSACHLTNMQLETPPDTCIGCHRSDDVHLGDRGESCDDCHGTATWEVEFDHFKETEFALVGAHTDLQCKQCHTTTLEDSLPVDCEGCHEDDDPHAGTLGACDACHSAEAWREQVRFDHEFTDFPLVGLHKLATCDQCHLSKQYNETPSECADCHLQEDYHDGVFGTECGECHTPGSWDFWDFDHDAQTTFALTGAHTDLICASCHSERSGNAENLNGICVTCHLADDAHNGQFGSSCDQCHTTESFDDAVKFR